MAYNSICLKPGDPEGHAFLPFANKSCFGLLLQCRQYRLSRGITVFPEPLHLWRQK